MSPAFALSYGAAGHSGRHDKKPIGSTNWPLVIRFGGGRGDRRYNNQTMKLLGIHHITAIAGDPQRNLDFYTKMLGLRLVKRTVNFDDPSSYHFYFGDRIGTPGTVITFFPWPGARRGTRGNSQVVATSFAIPPGSLNYWSDRLKEHSVSAENISRFDDQGL